MMDPDIWIDILVWICKKTLKLYMNIVDKLIEIGYNIDNHYGLISEYDENGLRIHGDFYH